MLYYCQFCYYFDFVPHYTDCLRRIYVLISISSILVLLFPMMIIVIIYN